MSISPNKVLLIVNSDEQVSLAVANYYITARGLSPHILSFPFGSQTTTNTPAGTYSQLVAIADYMIDNQIEAVIASAKCPCGFPITNGTVSFENLLGTAKYWKKFGRLPVYRAMTSDGGERYHFIDISTDTYGSVVGKGVTVNSDSTGFPEKFQRLGKKTFNWKGNPDWVPHGRIGIPKYNAFFITETYANSIRFIDDALINEQTYESAKGMPVHYHYLSAYGGYYGGAGSTEMARKRAATIGLGQKIAKPATGGYNRSWDTTLPVSDYPSSDFNDGLVKLPLWAMVGGYGNAGMFTNGTNHPVYQSYTLLDGAWGMGGMSNCLLGPGASMLNRGAVAWSGCTYEPFVAALLNPEEFMNCILQGLSMMEAAAHSNMVGGWMASTWGDPLYRPFGKQNTTLIG